MKGIFWIRAEKHLHQSDWRENDLAEAVRAGAKRHGDEIEIRELKEVLPEIVPCDLMLGIGVKSRDRFKAHHAAGISWAYFDKGYIRTRADIKWLEYWRLAVNGHQPTAYVANAQHTRERADSMGLELKPWRIEGDAIVVDGSSAKHYYFHGMGHPTPIARALVDQIRGLTDRPIIYRPKPSWKGATPIEGTEYARGRPGVHDKDMAYDLRRAHCVVTFGSNLCFDAVCFGVPAIVLGDGIAKPISSTSIEDIEHPIRASEPERRQWLNNCAWCQFKLEEFRSGMGWEVIKAMTSVEPKPRPETLATKL